MYLRVFVCLFNLISFCSRGYRRAWLQLLDQPGGASLPHTLSVCRVSPNDPSASAAMQLTWPRQLVQHAQHALNECVSHVVFPGIVADFSVILFIVSFYFSVLCSGVLSFIVVSCVSAGAVRLVRNPDGYLLGVGVLAGCVQGAPGASVLYFVSLSCFSFWFSCSSSIFTLHLQLHWSCNHPCVLQPWNGLFCHLWRRPQSWLSVLIAQIIGRPSAWPVASSSNPRSVPRVQSRLTIWMLCTEWGPSVWVGKLKNAELTPSTHLLLLVLLILS